MSDVPVASFLGTDVAMTTATTGAETFSPTNKPRYQHQIHYFSSKNSWLLQYNEVLLCVEIILSSIFEQKLHGT